MQHVSKKLLLTVIVLVLGNSLVYGDPVCNNLKKMIHNQQRNYSHYQHVNHKAHRDRQQAKANVESQRRIIVVQEAKVEKLLNQLSKAEQRLATVKQQLAHEHHRVAIAMRHKESAPADVIHNEKQLITALSKKYKNMCLSRNPDDPAQSALVQVFYP